MHQFSLYIYLILPFAQSSVIPFDVGDSLDTVGALAKVKAQNDKKKIFISQISSINNCFAGLA
jgi:hypothetical protein